MKKVKMASEIFSNKYKNSTKLAIPAAAESLLTPVFQEYRHFLELFNDPDPIFNSIVEKDIRATHTLSPPLINDFLSLTAPFENLPQYRRVTGMYVTSLIQASHNHGYTRFCLTLDGLQPLHSLCAGLAKHRKQDLCVILEGRAGNFTVALTNGGTYFVADTAADCGIGGRNLILYIGNATGNIGEHGLLNTIKYYDPSFRILGIPARITQKEWNHEYEAALQLYREGEIR